MTDNNTVTDIVNSVSREFVTYVGDFDLRKSPVSVTQETRTMCEQNLCGNYGRNWCCPPNVPPCDTCRLLLSRYTRMTLVRTTFPRGNVFDLEEMTASMKAHNDYTRELRRKLRDSGIDFKILAAGGCGFCRSCSCPDEACRFPEERLYSIESYGIDLTSFLTANDIDLRGGTEQSYFTMIFHSQ